MTWCCPSCGTPAPGPWPSWSGPIPRWSWSPARPPRPPNGIRTAASDLSAYAPALGPGGQPGLPLSLGLGALLLDQAGYTGRRILQAVAGHEPARTCAALGAQWAATGTGAAAMLAMGDGSARRSTAAPGYLDERAVPFDTAVEDAVRAGDLAALAGVDPALARDLMATGRPAWQVLAGALGPSPAPGHQRPVR